jgi:myo-inositol-1(or 4)-monophosphatase
MEKEEWVRILIEAADRVYESARNIKSEVTDLDVKALKNLLDQVAQKAIHNTLKKHAVSAKVVSEEGNYILGNGDHTVVLDPIDGTTNLARSLPPAVTSMAISETGKLSGTIIGVIKDLFTGDVYHAINGEGAWHNSNPIKTASPIPFRDALTSIDLSKSPRLGKISSILETSRHLREPGCSAMSLCYLARGSLDVHIDVRGILRATDVNAGLLILREAGGVYTIDGKVFGDLSLMKETRLELVSASNFPVLQEVRNKLFE